jgi:glycine dehydrogenase
VPSAPKTPASSFLAPLDTFERRHNGPSEADVAAMLATLGVRSLDALIDETVPASIRLRGGLSRELLPDGRGERELLDELAAMAARNRVLRSYLGLGYHGTLVPAVIQRNVLENPGWYTQYTPYQAEISQGRLEALLNYQTMVADLTGLPLSNASLLDEATAAAEALMLCFEATKGRHKAVFAAQDCHPQTLAVIRTRAAALGWSVHVGDPERFDFAAQHVCGAVLQYPDTHGALRDPSAFIARAHAAGALVVAASDLLALCLVKPPGELGADVAVGSAQRFGVPLGYGGPHAAFLSTREEFKRHLPGRIIGVSKDASGRPALRMALQTREQHIRREKASSNICTAQVLLAVMAGMYGVYHGPQGLRAIAGRVHALARTLARGVEQLGHRVLHSQYFDTLEIEPRGIAPAAVVAAALARGINLRTTASRGVIVALDETVREADLDDLLASFAPAGRSAPRAAECARGVQPAFEGPLARSSDYLTHPVFSRYHTEHELLRYLKRLEARDLSLTTSMIPLGSCTMKLNATSEMMPVSWPEFGGLHPFAPRDQAQGYAQLIDGLERALCEITGLAAMSLQPNAGSQGEYAGLLVIKAWHASRGQAHRDVCLIPVSAHGTNPASAVLAGLRVVAVACDARGNIDLADLRAKAAAHADTLAALMVTYPSTHGVFEEDIRAICEAVHRHGGQVYMDGANMNAQVGLCRPADFGADVCHLNLHKTFCIPHGGGGPGMGPIGVAAHLAPFLPGHPLLEVGGAQAVGAVSAAPWGSASILTIPWVYIALMGAGGLERATKIAILNANYMAARLERHFQVLYKGARGRVAHEFIIDFRPFEKSAGVLVEDVAKRLMDYGFHSPTMSFPVAGTLMIEPTESESRAELDRLCDALIAIRGEIRDIEESRMDRKDNPLKNAPHTARAVTGEAWSHPYGREQAAFPAPWTREHKFWPSVARVDNGFGDKHLVCSCPPMEAYAEEPPLRPEAVGAGR